MPEIIPNWHPAAVHFPIALAITATLLLLLGRWRPQRTTYTACGRLLVLGAALSAVLAAMLGWYAFATVEHDGAGHRVMLTHRTWALVATVGLIAVAIWDGLREGRDRPPHGALLPIMVVLSACLAVTGWLGAEMVYRHGVGVSAAAFAAPEPPPPPAVVQPEAASPAIVTPPAVPAPVAETPALAPGEHIHRDGKRHRH